MRPHRPLLSVIVPAHNAADMLPRSLAALAASDLPRECWELLVVDDASTDRTASVAARWADTVVRLPGEPNGPAYARNRGADVSRGEYLVFVDADVAVHPDTLRRFTHELTDDPTVSAVFGSYDGNPPERGVVSLYRNLLHHWVHQQSPGDADTFWAGCGAIRRDVFAEAGAFDEWHFSRPQIEDIELGHRVRDLGHRIVLRPEIQATHLKRWTLRGVVSTDIHARGVPWMRLLIQQGATIKSGSLNVRTVEKVKTALVWLAVVFLGVAAVRQAPTWAVAALGCVLPVALSNAALYAFFARAGGVPFMLAAIPLHLLYYLINGVSAGLAWLLHQVMGEPSPAARVQAFAEVGVKVWPPVPTRQNSGAWRTTAAPK